MPRRAGLLLSLVLAGSSLAAQTPADAPRAGAHPNVVLIEWNDPALERLGFLGHAETSVTPRLDGLLAEGTRFPAGVQVSARGHPTAAALLTGRYPHESGIYYQTGAQVAAGVRTLPRLLQEQGYAGLYFGPFPEGAPRDFGFERGVRGSIGKGSPALAAFVAEFAGQQPLFVWWAPDVPDGYGAKNLDDELAALLDALAAHGQRENTLFAFVTNGPVRGKEFSARECSAARMRNPLALAWKGRIPAGERAERVTPLDLLPTLLDYLGLPLAPEADGRSLRALVDGKPLDERALPAAFFANQPEMGSKVSLRDPGRELQALVLHDGGFKYVLYLQDIGIEIDRYTEMVEIERSAGDQNLFDLQADPAEEHDLFGSSEHAARLASMREKTLAWWRASDGPDFPMPFLPPNLGPPPAEPRPNIVLVVADDMDYEHLGFLGNPRVRTPTLDELARTGVVFPVAHVPMSVCRPSLAALLSGRWPQQNGIYENEAPRTLSRRHSLPNLLKAAGYANYLGGKFWEGSHLSMGFLEPRAADTVFKSFVRETQAELFRFIDRYHAERPFFVWWAPMLPHKPYDAPERCRAPFRETEIPVPPGLAGDAKEYQEAERTAYAMGAWFDEGLAALRAKLAEAGELEDTLFVFLIDNGNANGSPSKGTVFEKGLRTPVVFSWPKGIAGGRARKELVCSVDLYRTILDYAGVAAPAGASGVDLRPLLDGLQQGGREQATRDVIYGAVYDCKETDKRQRAADGVYALYARTERWKFVFYLRNLDARNMTLFHHDFAPFPARTRGERDLFDLEQDPYERTDLADDPAHEELMDELLEGCLAWWRETGGDELALPGDQADAPPKKKKGKRKG